MRVCVTGSTGFVGSHCVEALSNHPNVQLVAACRDPDRLPAGFKGEARVGDLLDDDYVNNLLQGVDVVIHAAAWTALWNHKDQSRRLFLEPSLNLIETARWQGVKRFVFISTVSAAAPQSSSDPLSAGSKRSYWTHEANVVTIEDKLREIADETFCSVNLRLGMFVGSRYALGLLPILVPRLKTHLVPWVAGGRTTLPLIEGRDIGAAAALAATVPELTGYEGFNVVGPEIPTVREVIDYLHTRHGLPKPHFSVPFPVAFAFAWLMERLNPIVPWEPLVTRSIVHLMQETGVNNQRAIERLGYNPQHHWQQAVDTQLSEMAQQQQQPMKMARPIRNREKA